MLTQESQFKQFLKTNCFNIHVGLKCKEKHASRYFRDEYKKVNRLSDLFKKLSHKKESVKSMSESFMEGIKEFLSMNKKRKMAQYRLNYHRHQFQKMEQLIAENNQHTFLRGNNLNETR